MKRLYVIFILLSIFNIQIFSQSSEYKIKELVEEFWIEVGNIKDAEDKECYIRELNQSWGNDNFIYNNKRTNFYDFLREIDNDLGENNVSSYRVKQCTIKSQIKIGEKIKNYSLHVILERTIFNDINQTENTSSSSYDMELSIYNKHISISKINKNSDFSYQQKHKKEIIYTLKEYDYQTIENYSGEKDITIPSMKIERTYWSENQSQYQDRVLDDQVALTIEKVDPYWINATTTNNILSAKYPSNDSKDIQYYSFYLKQNQSGKKTKIILFQLPKQKFRFPSFIHYNNKYSGFELGISYNPSMPFGINGGYIFNRFYGGLSLNFNRGAIKDLTKFISNPHFTNIYGEEIPNMIPYSAQYDIEGKTKSFHDEFQVTGNIGYFLSDFFQLNVGVGFTRYQLLYSTDSQYIINEITENTSNTIISSSGTSTSSNGVTVNNTTESSSSSSLSYSNKKDGIFYMYSDKRKSISIQTGLKVYLPVIHDHYVINWGAFYNYAPNLQSKHMISFSIGLLFNQYWK